jgi:hypothetical protein
MKSRIIQLIICLTIGGMIAVYFVNPWQSAEMAKTMSYEVKTDNNWFYVLTQFFLMFAFVIMGFLWGVKEDGKS